MKMQRVIAKNIYTNLDFVDAEFLSISYWSITPISEGRYEVYSSCESPIDKDPAQSRRDSIYLEMATVWSKNSYCKRMQVGCLIVKNKSIMKKVIFLLMLGAIGFNMTASAQKAINSVHFYDVVFHGLIRLIDCVAVSGNGSFVADFPNVSPKRC